MRFNSRELAHLAQSQTKFDKEGVLLMKEKQDKLFKKGEAFVERLFRLRGNLLFYFKGKDARSEPVGLLILERCSVELDTAEHADYSFIIVYEGDDHTYTFAAKSEAARDSWIQALHIASYECLKMQVQSLREQVQAKTGKDPLLQAPPTETGMDFETQSAAAAEDPAMEISLNCDGLPNDTTGQPPNPFVVLYTILPPQQQTWLQHSHTEMVERNNSPHFLKTIGFGDASGLQPNTRVKIAVYHVKERMTGTMTMMGQVIFTMNDILVSPEMKLELPLQSADVSGAGMVTIVAWLNESMSVVDMQTQEGVVDGTTEAEVVRKSEMVRKRSKRVDVLKPICEHIITRTFRFDTSNDGVKLLVHEYMGESKMCFDIPIKLLKLYIEEERNRMNGYQELGQHPYAVAFEDIIAEDVKLRMQTVTRYMETIAVLDLRQYSAILFISLFMKKKLTPDWNRTCKEFLDHCMSSISMYSQNIRYLTGYKGSSFKPSCKKGDKELEFIPVNLHLQRMTVLNESTSESGCYDMITVGAFTAYARKYRSGGVWKMIQQQQEQYTPEGTLSKVTKIKRVCDTVNSLYSLKEEIMPLCDKLCQNALQGDGPDLKTAMDVLAEKMKDFIQNCASQILQETAERLAEALDDSLTGSGELTSLQRVHSMPVKPTSDTDKSPDKRWKWTGSNFVKSPTTEPWDMTRVNTEAALVCLMSMVDDLVENKSGPMDRPRWLGEISPAVMKMKSFVEIVCHKATTLVSFLDLIEHRNNLRLMHEIKTRRDINFCHGLTSLVFAFVTHLNISLANKNIMEQMCKIGTLAEFEGVLSCHSDEMGMLEDMVVAVDDLGSVTFQVVKESPDHKSISLSTNKLLRSGVHADINRHHIIVEVPLPQASFDKLPASLQQGQCIEVTPVLFNVGINEQATLAERFGNTTLQDKTNEESLGKLYRYIQRFEEVVGNPDKGRTGVGTISDLVSQLRYNVYAKKSKNVEILRLSSELCRKLNGMRLISCKSAKDRSSMSVTLEQVQILQQEHDLASHVFTQALDCFRSEGVRRENSFKNIGHRKYAFNSLQLLYFPKLYRPPNGTYGNVQG